MSNHHSRHRDMHHHSGHTYYSDASYLHEDGTTVRRVRVYAEPSQREKIQALAKDLPSLIFKLAAAAGVVLGIVTILRFSAPVLDRIKTLEDAYNRYLNMTPEQKRQVEDKFGLVPARIAPEASVRAQIARQGNQFNSWGTFLRERRQENTKPAPAYSLRTTNLTAPRIVRC